MTPTRHAGRRLCGSILMVLCFILGGGSIVSRADVAAGNDEDSPGLLDVRSWSHRHLRDGVVRHVLTFEDAWDSSVLDADEEGTDGLIALGFRVRTRIGAVPRAIQIGVNGDGSLVAPVVDDRGTRGFANAWKKDDRTLVVDVAVQTLAGRKPRRYSWTARTSYHPPEGTGTPCDDIPNEPDHGCEDSIDWVKHRLRP